MLLGWKRLAFCWLETEIQHLAVFGLVCEIERRLSFSPRVQNWLLREVPLPPSHPLLPFLPTEDQMKEGEGRNNLSNIIFFLHNGTTAPTYSSIIWSFAKGLTFFSASETNFLALSKPQNPILLVFRTPFPRSVHRLHRAIFFHCKGASFLWITLLLSWVLALLLSLSIRVAGLGRGSDGTLIAGLIIDVPEAIP